MVLIIRLYLICSCKGAFIGFDIIVFAAEYRFEVRFEPARFHKAGAAHIAYLPDRNALIQQKGKPPEYVFAHAVGKHIRTGIDKYAPPDGILPIIVMCEPACGGFQPAEYYRHIAVDLADAVAVYYDSPVRTAAHAPAGGVIIVITALFRNGIMRHHGIYIAGIDKKREPRFAEPHKIRLAFIIRLRDYRDTVPLRFQHARNDRSTEGRVIDICIARDKNKIRGHVLLARRNG